MGENKLERTFAEFYDPDAAYIDRVWENALITFDTSSLLNLYELSPLARQEALGSMKIVKDRGRLWMSHQVGLEFHRNRTKVAIQIVNQLNALRTKTATLRKAFADDAKHLDITQNLLAKFVEMEKQLGQAIEVHSVSGKKHPTSEHDTLLNSLTALFNDQTMIGKPYSRKRSKAIYKLGRRRYAANAPPGYKDDDRKPEPFKFGDLIVWMQIIDVAKKRAVPVILVTDDDKDDWTYDSSGRGAQITHPMLRAEFKKAAGGFA